VDANEVDRVMQSLTEAGEAPVRCGRIVAGKGVRYEGSSEL